MCSIREWYKWAMTHQSPGSEWSREPQLVYQSRVVNHSDVVCRGGIVNSSEVVYQGGIVYRSIITNSRDVVCEEIVIH
jgi:hypothetical protein